MWAEVRVKGVYLACSGLSGFMIWWVVVFPGSCHGTYLAAYKDIIAIAKTDDYVPFSLLTKYGPHLSVCLTHQLPSIFWSAALPFQLHPVARRRFPRAHRIVGRLWFGVSALLMYGVVLIDRKRLHYHINDFPSLPYEEASSLVLPPHVPHLDALVYHFLITAALALCAAMRRDIKGHRRWVCRHIAAGLWVAVQRVLIGVMHNVGKKLLGQNMKDLRMQKAVFGDAAYLGVVIAIAVAEVAAADLADLAALPPALAQVRKDA
eukprot:Tamp_24770.p1 GENE.Tamp_24770~~Tamp_24770.p1  ORF type:complete len:263 (-),score=27.60 Tamp_24770:184-972(-)